MTKYKFDNFKKELKKSPLIKGIYGKMLMFLNAYFPRFKAKLSYYIAYGKQANLEKPKTFSEKLLWLSLNDYRNNYLIYQLSDKYSVRDYVAEKGYSDILNELFYVWESPNEIDYKILPNKFALKLSQGCGTNYLCYNKEELDLKYLKQLVNRWDSKQYFYNKIMANIGGFKVSEIKKYYICEKLLVDNNSNSLIDYKIYCFNGIPKTILVISDRFKEIKGAFMSPEWTFISNLTGTYEAIDKPLTRPQSLGKMLDVAQKLSSPFPFVRVDLYEVNGKVVFGEMTFFPNGCINMQETMIAGKTMGELLNIDKEIKNL